MSLQEHVYTKNIVHSACVLDNRTYAQVLATSVCSRATGLLHCLECKFFGLLQCFQGLCSLVTQTFTERFVAAYRRRTPQQMKPLQQLLHSSSKASSLQLGTSQLHMQWMASSQNPDPQTPSKLKQACASRQPSLISPCLCCLHQQQHRPLSNLPIARTQTLLVSPLSKLWRQVLLMHCQKILDQVTEHALAALPATQQNSGMTRHSSLRVALPLSSLQRSLLNQASHLCWALQTWKLCQLVFLSSPLR